MKNYSDRGGCYPPRQSETAKYFEYIINNIYFPSTVLQLLAQLQGRANQELKHEFKWNTTRFRIPAGHKQTSWLCHKRGRGVNLGTTENKSS